MNNKDFIELARKCPKGFYKEVRKRALIGILLCSTLGFIFGVIAGGTL